MTKKRAQIGDKAILTVNVGGAFTRLSWHAPDGRQHGRAQKLASDLSPPEILARLAAMRDHSGVGQPAVIGHRMVHAGPALAGSVFIDTESEAAIRQYAAMAPLHAPLALNWVQACRECFGADVPQTASFDSALYAELPAVAAHYAIPKSLGLRRLGFHGLAHGWMLRHGERHQPAGFGQRKIISLQLGSGASITASIGGKPVDTSMGMTPLEGLVMNSRCGDLDPGIILYLQTQKGMSPQDIEALLSRRSGLLGLSGTSGDISVLLASNEPAAALAVDIFCYRIRKYIGAYVAVLGGLDQVLIGGGIGEHLPAIRSRVLTPLQFLGIQLNHDENQRMTAREGTISCKDSRVKVDIIQIQENRLIAEDAAQLLKERSIYR